MHFGRPWLDAKVGILSPPEVLKSIFSAALAAADPRKSLAKHLHEIPLPEPGGRLIVVGAGKAAAAMAQAVEAAWSALPLSGLVVTRYGHGLPCQRIEVVEAAHPLPDQAGIDAAHRILRMLKGLSEKDRVLALISGGGSALLSAPIAALSLAEKQSITHGLLRSGASIGEINCVRKHLSAIKGGRLALAAWPAPVWTLAISDVPGDDPAVIASGPTMGDPSTSLEAAAILHRYQIPCSVDILNGLHRGSWETPKPGDPHLARSHFRLIASPKLMLAAAASQAKALGINVLLLGDALEGEAREVGKLMAGIARSCHLNGYPAKPPCLLLSGGETTVTVKGHGKGGRNTEFLLGLMLALDGMPMVHALAADTDGIDGSESNAGAIIAPDSLTRARGAGLDPLAILDNNDAWSIFAALGDLLVTGPTLTNVNDFRAILVGVE